jgi:hypothetical protein
VIGFKLRSFKIIWEWICIIARKFWLWKKYLASPLLWMLPFFLGMFATDIHEWILRRTKNLPELYYQVEEGSGVRCWNGGAKTAEEISFYISWKDSSSKMSLLVPRPVDLEGLTRSAGSIGGKLTRLFPETAATGKFGMAAPENFKVLGGSSIQSVSIAYHGDRLATELPLPHNVTSDAGLIIQ